MMMSYHRYIYITNIVINILGSYSFWLGWILLVLNYFFQRENKDLAGLQLFYDGGRYHMETSPLICRANQWTGFYIITASVLKELT